MVDVERYAQELAEGIDAAMAGWVVRSVCSVMEAWRGECPPDVAQAAAQAGQVARAETGAAVRALLEADIDDQRSTPLTLVRAAVRWPTQVLAAAGAPPVGRDAFKAGTFPDDVYDLTPATFADIDPGLSEAGIAWGAAKAWEHKRRHAPRSSEP